MVSSSLIFILSAVLVVTALSTHVLQRGADCTHRPNDCASGLACDGRGSQKRCIIYKNAGMECRINEPFWICQLGLTCEDETCRTPRNSVCTDNRDDCVTGTNCDGRGSTKRCIVYKQPNMRCLLNEPFWICEPGLDCENEVCKIPVGGSCSSAPTACASGSTCVGSGRSAVCAVVPRELGETCGGAFECRSGLECDGRCRLPKKADCLDNPTQCVSGTVCSGTRLKKLCSPVRGEGHRCSEVGFLPCDEGLSCVGAICVRGNVPKGKPCRGAHEACSSGLVCAGPSHNRICVSPMQKGQFCKGDPYWKCDIGLRCLHRYCVEY